MKRIFDGSIEQVQPYGSTFSQSRPYQPFIIVTNTNDWILEPKWKRKQFLLYNESYENSIDVKITIKVASVYAQFRFLLVVKRSRRIMTIIKQLIYWKL